ncbi:serine protease inhibitor Kazal-type 8 isoform X2 [Mesocricetus auratus]|uniref:Serine protease inhibitor Kazal-type 8 isoform X2 n=1 Tax=Mesocricetus auratus TaxID=10036 RepID=A0A1U7QM52_MESAU|nr:serine protease inhibitor Kazal-type 8 isoform X2 [Mesocricetus auratus]
MLSLPLRLLLQAGGVPPTAKTTSGWRAVRPVFLYCCHQMPACFHRSVTMKAAFSTALLVLAISVGTSFAVDFYLPMSARLTEELFQETKVLCNKNVRKCWMLSYYKPDEPICGTDQVTYGGECHLCSRVLYDDRTIIKMHDGECIYSLEDYE